MSIATHIKWFSAALLILLSACSSLSSAADEAPPAEAAPQVTLVEAGQLEKSVEEAQPVVENVEPATMIEETEPEIVAETNLTEEGETVDIAAQAEQVSSPEEPPSAAEVELAATSAAGEKVRPEDVIVNHSAPSPEQQQLLASLNVLGQPPELFNEVWLNSEPLKLADLQGKVVIIEFWTFG